MSDTRFSDILRNALKENEFVDTSKTWVGEIAGDREEIRAEFDFKTGAPGEEEFKSIDSKLREISSKNNWRYVSTKSSYGTNIQRDGNTGKYYVYFER